MNGELLILLLGEAASGLGSNLFDLAVYWELYRFSHNPGTIGAIVALLDAVVVLNLWAGSLADRYRKTTIMLTVDGLQITVLLIGWVMLRWQPLSLTWLVLVILALSILGTGFGPAEDALIPQLATPERLASVISLNQALQLAGRLTGLLVGGTLVVLISISDFTLVDLVSFGISLSCVALLRHRSSWERPTTTVPPVWWGGLRYVQQHVNLRRLIGLAMVVNCTMGPLLGLDVIWVRHVLRASAISYSWTQILFVVGSLLGMLLVRRVPGNLLVRILGSLTVMALALLNLTWFRTVGNTLGMFFVIGGLGGFLNVSLLTAVQQRTPQTLLGRVNGTLLTTTNLSLPVGNLLGGQLASQWGLPTVYRLGASVTLLVVALTWLTTRSRHAQKP